MTPFEQGYGEFMKLAMSIQPETGKGEKYTPWYGAAIGGVAGSELLGKAAPGKWKIPAKIMGALVGTAAGVHGGEALGRKLDNVR